MLYHYLKDTAKTTLPNATKFSQRKLHLFFSVLAYLESFKVLPMTSSSDGFDRSRREFQVWPISARHRIGAARLRNGRES